MSMNLSKRIKIKKTNFSQQASPPFAKSIMLELTNACQYGCVFCAHHGIAPKEYFLPFELGKRFLEDAFALGTREVGINGCGEQFLHKDVANFVKTAKEIGYTYIYATSNGASPEQRYLDTIDAGLDSLKFSFNALNAKEYATTHRTGNKMFDRVVAKINRIAQYAKTHRSDMKMYMSCVTRTPSQETITALQKLFPKYFDEILPYKLRSQQGQIFESGDATEQNCHMIFDFLRLTATGHLNTCCADFQNMLAVCPYTPGRLAQDWHCETYTSLREKALSNKLAGTLCYRCLNRLDAPAQPLNKAFVIEGRGPNVIC